MILQNLDINWHSLLLLNLINIPVFCVPKNNAAVSAGSNQRE